VPVQVVDTVGAGDAFCAGLLAWLWKLGRLSVSALGEISLEELEAALGYASAVAAAQCSRASAWGPTAADVEQLRELHDATGARSRESQEGSDGVARIR
jgi:fructokinase